LRSINVPVVASAVSLGSVPDNFIYSPNMSDSGLAGTTVLSKAFLEVAAALFWFAFAVVEAAMSLF